MKHTVTNDRFKEIANDLDDASRLLSLLKPRKLSREQIRLNEQLAIEEKRTSLPKVWQKDIAWNALVELYGAHQESRSACVKHVLLAANAPSATVHRHLVSLVKEGWVLRQLSWRDQRVVKLSLSGESVKILDQWADSRSEQIAKIYQS